MDEPSVQAVNAGSCTWLGFQRTCELRVTDSPEQIVSFKPAYTIGGETTVRFNVTTLSQPVVVCNVSV